MKKTMLIILGSVFLTALAAGITKYATLSRNRVDTFDSLILRYMEVRESCPPMPLPFSAEAFFASVQTSRFDFEQSDTWLLLQQDPGILYAEESKELALTLKLPVEILIYESIEDSAIVMMAAPEGTEDFEEIVRYSAPAWGRPAAGVPADKFLLDELTPRRVCLHLVLRDESSMTADLFAVSRTSSLSAPMPIMMSSATTVTDFRILQDSTNLSVNLPSEFSNTVITLQACTNLVEGVWTHALVTNAANSGVMNLGSADIPDLIYYRVDAYGTNDNDGDLLLNLEEYTLGTDFEDSDSDNDNMPDGWEVQQGFDPLDSSDGSGDPDGDGYTNALEYAVGADPHYFNPVPEISVTSPQNQSTLP